MVSLTAEFDFAGHILKNILLVVLLANNEVDALKSQDGAFHRVSVIGPVSIIVLDCSRRFLGSAIRVIHGI